MRLQNDAEGNKALFSSLCSETLLKRSKISTSLFLSWKYTCAYENPTSTCNLYFEARHGFLEQTVGLVYMEAVSLLLGILLGLTTMESSIT